MNVVEYLLHKNLLELSKLSALILNMLPIPSEGQIFQRQVRRPIRILYKLLRYFDFRR